MKLKNILLSGLSLVLVAALAIGGTVAYLQDDDSDVNVMILGNVSIEQHEYERVVNADGTFATDTIDGVTSYVLKDFTQGKDLLPIVGDPSTGAAGWDNTVVRMTQVNSYGSMQVFAGKNAQDKFVTVENTGKTDAYVRTLVAIEVGSTDGSLVGSSYHQTWTKNPVGTIEIDGNNYYVTEYVYAGGQLSDGSWRHGNGILPAGDTSYPSLSQVYIKSSATNEDMEKIDGNGNGTLDILVLSQAVQAAGFDNAEAALNAGFGVVDANSAAEWFDGVVIPVIATEADVFDDVLANGGEVLLDSNIGGEGYTPAVSTGATVSVDMKGNTVYADYFNNNGDLTLKNGVLESGSASDYGFISRANSNTVLYNVEVNSAGGGIGATDGAYVEINGGSVDVSTTSTSGRYNVYAVGEGTTVVINDGTFSFSKTLNQKRAYIYAGAGATVIVNGGNFGPASTRSGYTAGILGEGTVVIKGGTFGFNPSNWVADGYEAVQNGNTWTVVAK